MAEPELSWLMLELFMLFAVASPDPAVADDVPSLVPVLSFVASPALLPASESVSVAHELQSFE